MTASQRLRDLARPSDLSVILTLTLATFLSSLANYALGPFLPTIARDLNVGVASLGQVPALAALLVAFLGLFAGPLADQIGYRRSLLLGLCTLALSTLGIGLATSFALLLLPTLVGAFGRAVSGPVSQAVAGSRFVGDARRRALGWLMVGTSGAVVVGVPVLTSIDSILGWRAAFVAPALLCLAAAGLIARNLGPDGPLGVVRLDPTELATAYRPLVHDRPTLGLIGGFLQGVAGTGTVLTYLGAYLVERYDFSTQQIGWVYLAIGTGALIGSVAAGGRLGARPLRPLLIGSRITVCLLVGGAFLLGVPALGVVALLTLALVLAAASTVATATLLTGETPAGRATTMALNGAAGSLGTALGAGLGGLLLSVGSFTALGLGAMAWYAGGAAIVWWSRPRRTDLAGSPA